MPTQPAFCPLSTQTLFDSNGCLIRGGNLYVYDAQTTKPRAAFSDAGLTLQHEFPIKTSGFGRIPNIYLGPGNYKVVVKDARDCLLEVIDDLPGGTDAAPTAAATSGWKTGDIKAAHTDDTQDGWLKINGGSIGNPQSSATARASDDCKDLFIKLWNKDASLVVSNGRGATATSDWNASKTLALPDYRGRMLCGVDQMGAASAAGRLTSATTVTPNKVGASFGNEAATLGVDQLPTFTPQVTISAAGAHTHGGSTGGAGAHSHTGTTSSDGQHNHGVTVNYITVNGGNAGAGPAGSASGGSGTEFTSQSGQHLHSVTTNAVADHTHGVTISGVADHVHTATAAAIGSGQAHGNMPPSILIYWLIKL